MIHVYIITSERAGKRADEYRNTLFSENEYNVGDIVKIDGLNWRIEDVVVEDENESVRLP